MLVLLITDELWPVPEFYEFPDRPIRINNLIEPFVLEILPAYANIFPELTDYQTIHIAFSAQVKGVFIDDFIGHPKKARPIAIKCEQNYVLIAFPIDIQVTQIQYIGSRIKRLQTDLTAEKFNLLVYYRLENPVADYFEYDLFKYLNEFLVNASYPPKKLSKKLQWAARSKVIDVGINDDYEHYSRYYGKYGEIYKYFGIDCWSYENLGGAQLPDSMIFSWARSPGHNAAMKWNPSHFGGGTFYLMPRKHWYAGAFAALDTWEHEPFTFGEDFKFEYPYQIMDPVELNKIFILVGMIMFIGILSIVLGAITALVVRKKSGKIKLNSGSNA